MRKPLFLGGIIISLLFAGTAWAQGGGDEPTFSVSPPPLAYPDYEIGDQSRMSAASIRVSAPSLSMSGFNLSYNHRRPWLSEGETPLGRAVGVAYSLSYVSGSGAGIDVSALTQYLGVNYEHEGFKEKRANGILFLGPSMNLLSTYITGSGPGYYFDSTSSGILFGYQYGVQVSFEVEVLKISPFYQVSSSSGTINSESYFSMYSPCCASSSTNTSVSITLKTTSFGFDILHVPSGMTLSSLSQLAQGGKSDVKVTILQISYAFGEGVEKSRGDGEGKAEGGLDINFQKK